MLHGVNVWIKQSSIEAGQDLTVVFANGQKYSGLNASINFASVNKLWDMFALGIGAIVSLDGTVTLKEQTKDLKPGLYYLGYASIHDQDTSREIAAFKTQSVENVLFEVREPSKPALSKHGVLTEFAKVIERRQAEFDSGIGDPSEDGAQPYQCFIFVKDCLITGNQTLGKFEVIPYQGLSCEDEIENLRGFCQTVGLPEISNTAEFIKHAVGAQPVAVVHYPKVFATSPELAGALAERESAILSDVLSLNRNGYGTIFGAILVGPGGRTHYRIDLPTYTGNLMGGFLSGESPDSLYERFNKARVDERLQLYLSLYKEALLEKRIEIGYFRLWNILETIARSKGYIGQQARDWAGNVRLNRKSQPILIDDQAEQLVFELLRQSMGGAGYGASSHSSGLAQGTIEQMIAIWYRHRNCMGHQGGCHNQDPNYCLRDKNKFINCKSAHDEIITMFGVRDQFTDQYYRALRDIVKMTIEREFV